MSRNSPAFWGVLASIGLILLGILLPFERDADDGCSGEDGYALFDFDRFSDEDYTFAEAFANNVFGLEMLILLAGVGITILLKLSARSLQVAALMLLFMYANIYMAAYHGSLKSDFVSTGIGAYLLWFGSIGLLISAALLEDESAFMASYNPNDYTPASDKAF